MPTKRPIRNPSLARSASSLALIARDSLPRNLGFMPSVEFNFLSRHTSGSRFLVHPLLTSWLGLLGHAYREKSDRYRELHYALRKRTANQVAIAPE